ncbi:MAG: hypothetical protein HC929_10830, partial [Leptolyngbyaceae cyanobacterium SM2_5_2]|nr:hypothetical protein [Leptolyngbyaceae cyanobacterium SM2_5_2]
SLGLCALRSRVLGTVEATGDLRFYAAQQPPTIHPTWDAALRQNLEAFQCQEDTGVE